MTREELEPIAEVVKKHNLLVLSDEIYAEMTYNGKHVSIASLPDMKDRCIVINGFSKAFAMTGWRLGFTLANEEMTKAMTKVHQYGIMSAPTTAQFAAIEAMRNGDEDVRMMREEYNRRRRYLTAGLRSIGLSCFEPEGAFYVFPCIAGTGLSSEEFCRRLLEEYDVAIVPGNAFGDCGEGFARISYAYSVQHISKALERMESFLKSLRN